MKSSSVEINMHGHGRGEVFVDGVKVPRVKSFTVAGAVDTANSITLTLVPDSIKFAGPAVIEMTQLDSIAREFQRAGDALDDLRRVCELYGMPGYSFVHRPLAGFVYEWRLDANAGP
jgi:hypothetical protein